MRATLKDNSPASSATPVLNQLSLSVLPALLLDILLPPAYPYSPPVILSLHATHSWLPLGLILQRRLLEMWQEGEGVLYIWIEWLRNGDFLEALNLTSALHEEQVIR